MIKSLFAFAAAKPIVSAALGLTLLAATGAVVALNCECSGESVDSLASVDAAQSILVSTALAADEAPADAKGADCDKPCPYATKGEATTTAAAPAPVEVVPVDAKGADCNKPCDKTKSDATATTASADAAPSPSDAI